MDFQSAMETFAEAWVAANAATQTQALALTRSKSPKKDLLTSAQQLGQLANDLRSEIADRCHSRNISPKHSNVIQSEQQCQPHINAITNDSNSSSHHNQHHINNNNTNNSLHANSITNNNNIINNNSSNNINSNSCNNSSNNNNNNSGTLASSTAATVAANLAAVNLKLRPTSSSPIENGVPTSTGYISDKLLPSPSMDRKDFDFSKINAKSLPLHCIVESITSLQASLCIESRTPWKRRPNIETDSYVIVPAATLFSDIVNTALQRLGYSPDIASTARGSIIIKNWKPLALEKISDSPMVCVGDILGELTSVVTLRIVILRTKPSTFLEIKDKLLKLLVIQSHAVLRSAGCPLDEMTLSQICRNSYQNSFPFSTEISEEMRRKFDQWWSNQLTPQSNPITPKMLPFINPQPNEIDFVAANHHIHATATGNRTESLMDNHHHVPHHNMIVHPALQTVHSQYPSQKTRMRTSFDPEMELPKLQRWFHENPHPSRQQIQSYVIQLNSLESRRGRKPLDVNNVVYWFKNARAAQKRAEMRGQGMGNGFPNPQSEMMLPNSDYLKSPHSLKSEDCDNMSQHSDDLDDELDRPVSPQLPLSLTTHERHRSSSTEENLIKTERDRSRSPSSSSIRLNNAITHNGDQINDISEHSHLNDNQDTNQQSDSLKNSPQSEEDLDMESDINPMDDFRSPSPDSRRDLPFPMVPNSMFSHSIMYMSHYIPQIGGQAGGGGVSGGSGVHHPNAPNTSPRALTQGGLNLSSLSSDERRKRNRTFIDPVTEVPKLEQWFSMNTHPSHNLILKYTEDLNRMPYRQKFPRLESKNVQFWFKNRRAKCKRLKMSLYDPTQLAGLGPFSQADRD